MPSVEIMRDLSSLLHANLLAPSGGLFCALWRGTLLPEISGLSAASAARSHSMDGRGANASKAFKRPFHRGYRGF